MLATNTQIPQSLLAPGGSHIGAANIMVPATTTAQFFPNAQGFHMENMTVINQEASGGNREATGEPYRSLDRCGRITTEAAF